MPPRAPTATATRYYPLPVSFFTDDATAGLSPLAACIYLRARAASLIGVLQLSPRVLGRAHGEVADTADKAVAELVDRGLALWDADQEILLVLDALDDAKGSARASAVRQVAALTPGLRTAAESRMATTAPPTKPAQLDLATAPPPAPPVRPNRSDSDSDSDSDSRPEGDAPTPPDPVDVHVEAVLFRIDRHRVQLGERPLPPSQRNGRHVRARLVEDQVPVDDLLLAVDLRAVEAKADPKAMRYFDATSPFTPPHAGKQGGWSVSAGMLAEHRRKNRGRPAGRAAPPGPPSAGPPDQAAADFAARVEAERTDALRRRESGDKPTTADTGGPIA